MQHVVSPDVVFAEVPREIAPPVPETLEDTGISPAVVESLVLKFLFFRGEMLGRDLATALGLKFSVIQNLIDALKRGHAISAKRSLSVGDAGAVFALSDSGRALCRDAMEKNQYVGTLPVPLHQYSCVVRHQRPSAGWLTREKLVAAYRHMTVSERVLSQIGPAISSGNSLLIYGQPGNGKTYMAEAVQNIAADPVYIPYAIECQGNVVQVFDPLYHFPVEQKSEISIFQSDNDTYDQRWVKCRRPFIVTGGELALEMLDLTVNPTSHVYDAPFQMKANNGIYLIDDFGRQRVSPAEVLNRWIVPMERRVDYLNFESGGKMTVPFETFLIFSTNLKPDQLGDEAFLRRIQYKMLVRSPERDEFLKIFRDFCVAKTLPVEEGLAERFVERFYAHTGKPFRRCQPRDVISHAIDFIHFEDRPYRLTEEVLVSAFESCFTSDVEN